MAFARCASASRFATCIECGIPTTPKSSGAAVSAPATWEEDLAGARDREATLRSAARRRFTWPDRKAWKRSQRGSLHISAGGYHVTIFPKAGAWSGVISREESGFKRYARRTYQTARDAQLAAFDALVLLKSKQP